MWQARVSNPGPLTYESGALPTALRGPAKNISKPSKFKTILFRLNGSCRKTIRNIFPVQTDLFTKTYILQNSAIFNFVN